MWNRLLVLALFLLAMPLAVAQGESAEQSAQEISFELRPDLSWSEAQPLVARLKELGGNSRVALPNLLARYGTALREKDRIEEVVELREALAAIGAQAPFRSSDGVVEAWCPSFVTLGFAIQSVLDNGSKQEIEAVLAIPGVIWDAAPKVFMGTSTLTAALVGLENSETARLWAIALRTTFGQRATEGTETVIDACTELNRTRPAKRSLFLRISLWGHHVRPWSSYFSAPEGMAALTELAGLEELIHSDLAHEREAAAFLLAELSLEQQDPDWLLGLLQDKDAVTCATAIWAVGLHEYGSSDLPFVPHGIPGAAKVKPSLLGIGGGAGGKFGGRAASPSKSVYEQALYWGALYADLPTPRKFKSAWDEKQSEDLKAQLQKLEAAGEHPEIAFWTLCRFVRSDGKYLAKIEAAASEHSKRSILLRYGWEDLILRAGGPSHEFAVAYLERYRGLFALELQSFDIPFVIPSASLEAQDIVAAQFETPDKWFFEKVDRFPAIEGELADLLIELSKQEVSFSISLLPRSEGGPAFLARMLRAKSQVRRLTALVALTLLGSDAKFATPRVAKLYAKAADDRERKFIREQWGKVDSSYSFE